MVLTLESRVDPEVFIFDKILWTEDQTLRSADLGLLPAPVMGRGADVAGSRC